MNQRLCAIGLLFFSLSTMATHLSCDEKAEKAAKSIMSLNNVNPAMAQLTKREFVQDPGNTNYYIFQFVPLDQNAELLDLGYEISLDADSCKVIGYKIIGGN